MGHRICVYLVFLYFSKTAKYYFLWSTLAGSQGQDEEEDREGGGEEEGEGAGEEEGEGEGGEEGEGEEAETPRCLSWGRSTFEGWPGFGGRCAGRRCRAEKKQDCKP